MSPEAAAGGGIALIEEGDTVTIDIPGRAIRIEVDEDTLEARRAAMAARANPWQPTEPRKRVISKALRAYAHFAASADKGGIREI